MALMTMIARVVDGLPLVGSMQEDEQVKLLKKLSRDQFFFFNKQSFKTISVRKKCSGISKSS